MKRKNIEKYRKLGALPGQLTIYLSPWQYSGLRKFSKQKTVSMAYLVREAVGFFLTQKLRDRDFSIVK